MFKHKEETQQPASRWTCVLTAGMIAAVGAHLAWLIHANERAAYAVAAMPPPFPSEIVATPPAPVVTAPRVEPHHSTAQAAPAPGPGEPAEAAAQAGAAADEAGPEWTRRPLPVVGPALLRQIAAMKPPAGDAPAPGAPNSRSREPKAVPTAQPRPEQGAASPRPVSLSPGPVDPRETGATGAPRPRPPVAPSPEAAPPSPPAAGAPRPEEAPAPATPEAPLRISLWPNRGMEARYRPEEWVVLRLAASAPCFAALYRVGPSGTVTQVIAPAEKPAGSYGLAVKAGEHGTGEEWAVAVASAEPLSTAQVVALLKAQGESLSAREPLQAVLTHLQTGINEEAPRPEAWQCAVAAARYEVAEGAAEESVKR